MLSILRKGPLSRIRYGYVNPKIYHGKNDVKHDQKIQSYPFYGMRNSRSGVIIFNKPNYQNKLNFESMEQLYRFLKSYQTDENIQHMWVENKGYNCFSNGIDFQQFIKSPKYLHRVFQLGIMMSRINKPVFGYVKGLVGGTAAYLLKYLSTPFGDKNTHLKLHDVDNHFVPICGGSYLLSRLKGQLGAYLALTGDAMDANDMVGSGFIYALLRRDYTEGELRKAAGEASKYGTRYFTHDTYDFGNSREFDDKYKVSAAKISVAERTNLMSHEIMSSEQKHMRVARLAHVAYKSLEVGLENLKKPYNHTVYEELIDHFYHKEEPVLAEFKEKYIQPHKGEVVRGFPLLVIDRIFKYDTIEEIIAALKKQGTNWARNTIKKLQSKDPLALKLTLRLIREASKSTFPECLEREYRVASRLRLHEPFRKFHAGENVTQKQLSQINSQYVDRFFDNANLHHQLQHDIVSYSLLPVKQYRHNLPDSIRFWLNRQYWNDPNNDQQAQEVFRWLRRNNISQYNDSWNLDDLRRRIYLSHQCLGKMKDHWSKIDRIYYNHSAEAKFKAQRHNYIEEIFSKDNIQEVINQKIKENFNKRFHSRMSEMKPTAEIYAKEQKGKLYKAIRDVLVKKRLTEPVGVRHSVQDNLGLVSFDPNGKGRLQTPEIKFKGTPYEHIINASDEKGNIVRPLSPEYYEMLDQEVYPGDVQPLATLETNPKLIEVLRRYEQGMHFYTINDNRKDVVLVRQAAEYSDRVKQMIEKYSDEELRSIFRSEDKYTWRHLLRAFEDVKPAEYEAVVNMDCIVDVPTYSQTYDLNTQKTPLLDQISIKLPEDFNTPPQLEQRSQKLLKLITSKIVSNFGQWNSSTLQNNVPLLDNWVRQTVKLDINDFLQNDCHFVFSYFMIKDIEAIVKRLGNIGQAEELLSKLDQIGIKFETAQEVQQVFHRYLSDLVQLYTNSAKSILLKNSKLLEMHNRIQLKESLKSGLPEIDKILIQIGRLRLKIKQRSNPTPTVVNYDAQFNLQTLARQQFNDPHQLLKRSELSLTATAYDTKFKRLIKGYESYILRIDYMFKNINSLVDYLPENLVAMDKLEQFNTLTRDIDENQEIDVWFERKFDEAVETVFNHRLEAEKHLNVQELRLFDQEIAIALEPANLKKLMHQIIDNDIAALMQFKKQHIQSQQVGNVTNPVPSVRRFILNQDAFRKLTTLANTIDVLQSRELSHAVMERYQQTLLRLLEETSTEKKPSKPLDEKELQRIHFTTSAKVEKVDKSDVNFIKEELKVLTKILDEDEDMIQLSKILS